MKHCQVTYLLNKLMRELGTAERDEEVEAVRIALNVFESQAAEEKLQQSVKRRSLSVDKHRPREVPSITQRLLTRI